MSIAVVLLHITAATGSNLSQETITQDLMLWLGRGSILKRWLDFACHVISMAQMEVRKMLVTVFRRKKKEVRDSFRPVAQNLCRKYLSGDDIAAVVVDSGSGPVEEEPPGALFMV